MTQKQESVRKEVRLTFAPEISGEPLVCHLVREYDLTFSILGAHITPREEGYLTLELIGTPEHVQQGIAYLKKQGVMVTGRAQCVRREETLCMHCGLCTAVCPTGALTVEPMSREVIFTESACTSCGQCARVCPVKAMLVDTRHDVM